MQVDKVHTALNSMHRDVGTARTRAREAAVKRHNERTHVQATNFDVGDYVLVAVRTGSHQPKLQVKWKGPRRIVRVVSDFIYEFEDLLSLNFHLVHANRLKRYADSSLEVTEELLATIAHNDPHFQKIEKMLDLRYSQDDGCYQVQCKWVGFDYEDPTWEPIEILCEDVPKMLDNFLSKFPKKDLAKKARES